MGIGGSGSLGQLMVWFEADQIKVADRRVATAGMARFDPTCRKLDKVEGGDHLGVI